MMLKKSISLLLAIVMTFSLAVTAFATEVDDTQAGSNLTLAKKAQIQEDVSTYTKDTIKQLSFDELQYASTVAETDETATVIFNALVEKYASGTVNAAAKASLISNYVQFVKATKSGKNVTVKYRIKAKIPNGASIYLKYEFPSQTRTNGPSASLSGKKIGEYTQKFTVPTLMCQSRISSHMTARDYKETKVHETYNYKSKVYTDYHTVTSADVTTYWVVYGVVPALTLKYYAKSKIIQLIGGIISVGSTSLSVADSYSLSIGVPKPSKGQYYKTRTWYANNKVYAHTKVWNTKAAYDHGDLPVYDGKVYVKTELPTF